MSEIEMPDGQYLSLAGRIHPESGGQTRALLLRNRLLAQYAGLSPIILTLDDTLTYPEIRKTLREQGLLVGDTTILNFFEWHRENDIDHLPTIGEDLPAVDGFTAVDVPHPDGGVHKTQYRTGKGVLRLVDYRRPDGSVFLRVPAGGAATVSQSTKVYLVNSEGRPVGRWASQRGARKNWIVRLLEPDRRSFLICDSRYAIADIITVSDPRLHVMHLVHNIHVYPPYHANSEISPTYLPLLTQLEHLDGLVTLTDRQRQDIATRFGGTDSMYVVPNPVESPPPPDPRPARDPKRFVMLVRLEPQKRIEDAIRAFALVVKEEPDARLDIYGDGGLRAMMAEEIESHGLQDSVTLRGHDPKAADALWSASGMILTSRFEGYPLATLEAMSRGCPIVAYDIKYGPREQITPGSDGFLVEPEDLQGVADAVIRLARDPALVARMSSAAHEKAGHHDHRALIEDWRRVIEQVSARKEFRTTLKSVELTVSRLGFRRPRRLPDDLAKGALRRFGARRSGSAGFRDAPTVEFGGRLKVAGRSKRATLDEVRLTLDAVDPATGDSVPLPLGVVRSEKTFRLSSEFDPAEVFAAFADADSVQLRLRLVWHNSVWETTLARPREQAPNYELSYAGDGELSLLRGPRAPRG